MSTAKAVSHTPGPWIAEAETDRRPAGVSAPHNYALADVFGESRAVREANARLIAAAPEMLEALRNVAAVGHARDNVERANDKLDACIEWARAAIAKATE